MCKSYTIPNPPYLIERTGIHLDRNFRPRGDPKALPHRLYQQPHKFWGAKGRRAPSKKERAHPVLPPPLLATYTTVAPLVVVLASRCIGIGLEISLHFLRQTQGFCGRPYLLDDIVDVRLRGICCCSGSISHNLNVNNVPNKQAKRVRFNRSVSRPVVGQSVLLSALARINC